ncbi:VOC family protein [Larkinella knui]|uniref:VOC family protein n=1 Tax=Larkinella knui TaxID=2025310 RepID=A0A3P1CL90_9BACT|nr:VOC family protein [Larkinella knui]RRB13684.1 VOC family protein [Larkinella knui]
MKLNHLNLCVPDVAAATDFFKRIFDFECRETKGNNVLAVLFGEDNFVLVLSNFQKSAIPVYPPDFHLGFLVKQPERVHEVYQRLLAAGVPVEREPRPIRGSLGFYFSGPGNVQIEVSCLPENQTRPAVSTVA